MTGNTDPYFTVQYKAKQYISSKLVQIRHIFITDDKNYLAPVTALFREEGYAILTTTPFNVQFKNVPLQNSKHNSFSYSWPDDSRLTDTRCHNKIKYINTVVYDQKLFYFLFV